MKTVVRGPRSAELQNLIERRQALGIDIFDEVWEGSYYIVPAPNAAHAYLDDVLAVLLHPYAAGLVGTGPFNLGPPDDYRVPDRGYHRGMPTGTWLMTAALVVEIVSPDDTAFDKFSFYAGHEVDEVLVADPSVRRITLWRRASDQRYEPAPISSVLNVPAADLTTSIAWPDETHPS